MLNYRLKFAIFRTGRTQRQISLDALIPEGRLSSLVHGAVPSSSERNALERVLGADYFSDVDIRSTTLATAEARSHQ